MAPKRAAPVASSAGSKPKAAKKVKKEEEGDEGGEASGTGKEIDEGDTPLVKLYRALEAAAKVKALGVKKDGVVVYWMRSVLHLLSLIVTVRGKQLERLLYCTNGGEDRQNGIWRS